MSDNFHTESGFELKPFYTGDDLPTSESPAPGEFPFTRGIYQDMYRGRPWTMRQYSGFATATESNQRYRRLLEAGQTGLSVAYDLPTQMGYDSDDPVAEGEVGKVGVAIDSLADMETLMKDIPLAKVSTSMTINAPAAGLMLLYQLAAEKQGISGAELRGTVQNDILKEYAARGTYIFPPEPSMRLINVVRTTMEALAAVLGGTQSLHTNSYDEALALPTEAAATLALRTQQIIASESGVTNSADPLAGSFLIERLTQDLEAGAWKLINEVEEMGGSVKAIESGWMKRQIADSAYRFQQAVEREQSVIVA